MIVYLDMFKKTAGSRRQEHYIIVYFGLLIFLNLVFLQIYSFCLPFFAHLQREIENLVLKKENLHLLPIL